MKAPKHQKHSLQCLKDLHYSTAHNSPQKINFFFYTLPVMGWVVLSGSSFVSLFAADDTITILCTFCKAEKSVTTKLFTLTHNHTANTQTLNTNETHGTHTHTHGAKTGKSLIKKKIILHLPCGKLYAYAGWDGSQLVRSST